MSGHSAHVGGGADVRRLRAIAARPRRSGSRTDHRRFRGRIRFPVHSIPY
ncbi:hypothetical protein [Streptomyces sp. NPDC053427]